MLDCKSGTSRQRSGIFLGVVQDRVRRVPPPSLDEEWEVDDSRVQAEGLRLGVAKLGEAKEEIFREAQLQHLAVPVGIVGSQTTRKITAGGRRANVCDVEAQTTSWPLARS